MTEAPGISDDCIPEVSDVCRLAQNLASNHGYAVFPCRLVVRGNGKVDKLPARSERDGGHGFKDATKDLHEIAWLWQNWPGDLIGVATGAISDLDVLDVDPKHPEAHLWWLDHHSCLLSTRTFRTYSGGLHLYFQHQEGVKNTQGKIALGIDTRGDGGYVIYWFATGLECLDHTPPLPFPAWLLSDLKPKAVLRPAGFRHASHSDYAIDGILRRLSEASEGERNGMLFWCACRLAEGGIKQAEAEALLMPLCASIGLVTQREIKETRNTIRSAMGRVAA